MKVKVTLKGAVFEFETDKIEQVLKFFDHVYSRTEGENIAVQQLDEPLNERQEKERLMFPSKEEIENYILSKPNFEHTSYEIQKKFFGFTFSSRGERRREFLRLAEMLRQVRQKIAQEHNGKWQEKWYYGDKEKYKVFRFIPEQQE